jgi:hypothetical protein
MRIFITMKTIEQHIDFGLIGYTCRKYKITDYEINMDGSVNVNRSVNLSSMSLYQIPINFNIIKGDFICTHNHLTTLRNMPKVITGNFICSNNQIENLIGSPIVVDGDFLCDNNLLKSLIGAPKKIGGLFECSHNKLESIENIPDEVNGIRCDYNKIINLKGYPLINSGGLFCSGNQLKSFVYFPKSIHGSLMCYDNQIDSLIGCPTYIKTHFDISNNRLSSLESAPICTDGISTYNENNFPKVIKSIITYNLNINTFIKYQNYYQVWNGTFDQKKAIILLLDIINGLK